MPTTPFHIGPGIFAAALFFPYLDLATVLLASVILDIEPLSVLLFHPGWAYHGFLHTYIGGSVAALLLALALIWFLGRLGGRLRLPGYAWAPSPMAITISSFTGIYLHLFADSFVNTDMHPFWPYEPNPFLSTVPPLPIYIACVVLFLVGAFLYAHRARKRD